LHRLNNALKKFQDSINEVDSILMESFLSWEITHQVQIKHGNKLVKFDLSNPSTKQELERKQKDARELANLLVKRWLTKKASIPFQTAFDTSYKEFMFYMGEMIRPDIKVGKPYEVKIPQEQIDAWNRMRKIYFPEEKHEDTK
jgi:hypothetical protein